MIEGQPQASEQEFDSYRKLNKQLVKKIQERNKKIKFLFGCIQEYERIYVDQENLLNELAETLVRDRSPDQGNSSMIASEAKSVPAPRKASLNKPKRDDNIFKRELNNHSSISALKQRVFEEDKQVRLPMISNIRASNLQNPERQSQAQPFTDPKRQKSMVGIDLDKKKVYRVPMERLVPLSMDEIKQRIEKRFR